MRHTSIEQKHFEAVQGIGSGSYLLLGKLFVIAKALRLEILADARLLHLVHVSFLLLTTKQNQLANRTTHTASAQHVQEVRQKESVYEQLSCPGFEP